MAGTITDLTRRADQAAADQAKARQAGQDQAATVAAERGRPASSPRANTPPNPAPSPGQ